MFRAAASIAFAGSLLLVAGAPAHAKKVKPAKVTCEEFSSMSEDDQRKIAYWNVGYAAGAKVKEVDIGTVDIDREVGVLVVSCKETPKDSLLTKVEKHLPGGKKLVKPTKMTCEEFVGLESERQPEVVAWSQGYHHGVKVDKEAELDLETDVAVYVEDCRPAPKESFWAHMKKKMM